MSTDSAELEVQGTPQLVEEASPAPGASLEGLNGTVVTPPATAGFWKKWRAFVGPALLVSVGYMDPGNWGTDLQAGAQYRYGLLWVVALASGMAIILQICAARLGVVAGKDLAQACRDYYPAWTRWPNWLASETAIAACDLAEVLGGAVALNLLFNIPLFWGVIITALDVLLLLSLRGLGVRLIEAVILVLVATIGVCFFLEIFVLPQTRPDFAEMGQALVRPGLGQTGMLTLAVAIIGATVMPHNLYLHSALVQTRRVPRDDASIRSALRFNAIDSTTALGIAFFVNAAILVLAAMVFNGHWESRATLPDGSVVEFNEHTDWIMKAPLTLEPLMGTSAAVAVFAVALLASGQSSTITGTMAGQVVMEGFMHWRLRPWLRRLITRLAAIVPAVVVIGVRGRQESVNDLLVISQFVLGIQLPFAMIPLLQFTSSRRRMGKYANGWFLLAAGWASCALITALDVWSLWGLAGEAWNKAWGAGG
jgi:manganese transport protein